MPNLKIFYFHDDIKKFVLDLDDVSLQKVYGAFDLIQQYGHLLRLPHVRNLGKNLYELRILGREHIRFFYTLNGNRAVMLHVFVKKSQRIPAQDISLARNRLRAFVST